MKRTSAALSTDAQKKDGCLAFVDPPCSRPAARHNLCMGHMDGYEGTNWQRVEYIGFDGKTHSYIALDAIPPPLLLERAKIVRFLAYHTPSAGKCPCCHDPFGTDTSAFVLHTTWRPRGDITSVCRSCSQPGHRHSRSDIPQTTTAGPGSNGAAGDHDD